MKVRQIWIRGGLAVFVVGLLALGGIGFVRSQKATAEKTIDYLARNSLDGRSEAERKKRIEELAERVNRLPYEERQKFRSNKSVREAYQQMTEAERSHYLDLTLPAGMKQMMEAFNQMSPEKRQQIVQRSVTRLARFQGEGNREDLEKTLSDENVKKVVEQGLKSYMTEANASSKLEMQPLIDQMQNIMQGGR